MTDGFLTVVHYRLPMNHRRWDYQCCRWGGRYRRLIAICYPIAIVNDCRTLIWNHYLTRIHSLIARQNRLVNRTRFEIH
ncbi:hypothetical protein LOC70_02310 [Rhodopirellula sp. JC737]|nr:hypothetical protein [Rhodopirellula sp. JC737]